MNGLLTLVEGLAQFMTGKFGISVIILAVAGSFLMAALHLARPNMGFFSLGCGAAAFSAAYFVTLIGG